MTPPYNCFDSGWESRICGDSISRIWYNPPQKAWELAEAWDQLADSLEEDQLHAYLLEVGRLISPNHEYTELIQFIKSIRDNATLLHNYRLKLGLFVQNYQLLSEAALDFGGDSASINHHIKSLLAFDLQDWRTPALQWLSTGRNGADTVRFFALLDALVLGLTVLHPKTSAKISRRFEQVSRSIEDGTIITAANSPVRFSDQEWKDIQELVKRPQRRFARHLLLRLNADASTSVFKSLFPNEVEVEHILPQNPKADSAWAELFSEPQREHYTHLLGNMTLLGKPANASIKNRCFPLKKQRIYNLEDNQCFALTVALSTVPNWGC